MPDNTQTATAPSAAPAPSPKDFLAKAESAITDLHAGKLELHSDNDFEVVDDLETAPPDGETAPEEPEVDADPAVEEPLEGSEAQPFTVKTLPDAYITIKVDGEAQTVPLREMVDGYMRETAFHKRVNEVNELKKQASDLAERFKGERERMRSSLKQLLESPDEMYEFLETNAEQCLEGVARKHLRQMMEWQKDPAAKLAYDRKRHMDQIAKKEKKLREEQTSYQRERAEREATEKYRATFEPGYREGMKAAGYPQMTDELRTTIGGFIEARRRQLNGADLTSEDIKSAVVRAARAVKADTVEDRKPTPPKPNAFSQRPKTAPQRAPSKNGQTPVKKSFNQLFRDLGK